MVETRPTRQFHALLKGEEPMTKQDIWIMLYHARCRIVRTAHNDALKILWDAEDKLLHGEQHGQDLEQEPRQSS
jgi:hypothetical protein